MSFSGGMDSTGLLVHLLSKNYNPKNTPSFLFYLLWFSYVSGNVVQSDTKYIFFSKTDPRDFSVRNRVENRAASRVCPNSRKFSVLFLR